MADTLLPVAGLFSNPVTTNAQAKQGQDDILAYLRERFGNTDGVIDLGAHKLKICRAVDEAKGGDLASAATVDLGGATGNLVHVTGNTAITSFGNTAQAGVERVVVFDGELTLTHNAASLILPGGASITTAAGDVGVFRCESAGNWRCIAFTKANGQAVSGAVGSIIATAGEAIDTSAAPRLVYKDIFNQRGGGASRWYLVDSDATAPVRISPVIGIAISSAAGAGNTFSCHVQQGQVSGFTGLAADVAVWASNTAGALTQIEPAVPSSGTQNAVRVVGYAVSATTIMFEPWHDTVFQAHNSTLVSGASITVEHWTDSGARDRVARAYIAAAATPQMIAQATGTVIGDAPNNGALANLFDGTLNPPYGGTACAWGSSTARYGKNYSSVGGKRVAQATIHATSDYSWYSNTGTVYATLQGSQDGSSWTNIGTASGPDANNGTITVTSTDQATVWNYVRIQQQVNAPDAKCGECRFYEPGAARDEPEPCHAESRFSSATDKVTCKFADSSDTNQDTKTTFYNRTNATRDLIVEVAL